MNAPFASFRTVNLPRTLPGPAVHCWVHLVAQHYGIHPDTLCGDARTRHLVQARWIAMWLLYEEDGWSLPAIALATGRANHTTVLHGLAQIKRHPELLACATQLREQWQAQVQRAVLARGLAAVAARRWTAARRRVTG